MKGQLAIGTPPLPRNHLTATRSDTFYPVPGGRGFGHCA